MKRSHALRGRVVLGVRRSVLVMAAVTAVLAPLVASPHASAAPAPTATPAQQAEAIAKPGVVFIVTQWSGYLMNGPVAEALSPASGAAPKIEATTICSGFVANPSGYVVTAGHCVDNTSAQYGGKGVLIQEAVTEAVDQGYASADQASALVTEGYSNWTVEGEEAGSPPDRTVAVFTTKAGSTASSPLQANVVGFRAFKDGDVALLKVESKTPLPALAVASAGPATGSAVVAAGYPGSVLENVDPTTSEPSFKDGTVSGARTVDGVPFTEISAATSSGMSGGPVVDMNGEVVGTVSWTPGSETQAFNFITATSSVRDLLSSHNVANTLSEADQVYRAGLTDYFAGRYHAAAAKFTQALALEPDHAQAQEYRGLAIANYPLEKKSGSSTTMLMAIIGGAAVVLLVVGGFLYFDRRRKRRAATSAPEGAPIAVAGTAEPPASPASVAPPAPAPPAPAPPAVAAPGGEVPVAKAPAAPAAPLFCPECGTPHDADAHFCESCGHHFLASIGPESYRGN